MWWAIAWAALAATGDGPVIESRGLVAMHVLAPKTDAWIVQRPLVIERARLALEPLTKLTVVDPDAVQASPEALDRCAREDTIVCWVLALRPDYQRDGSVFRRPYAEHLDDLKRTGKKYARYVLLTTVLDVPDGPDRLTFLVIDTDRALASYHAASRDDPGWVERVEAEIFGKAAHTEFSAVDVADLGALDGVFRKFWEGRRWAFEPDGFWMPNGRVTLVPPDGTATVDGHPTSGTSFSVRAGRRRIEVVKPGAAPFTTEVEVREGGEHRVKVASIAVHESQLARDATAWSGVGLTVLGTGLVVLALVADPGVVSVRRCDESACGPGGRFTTFGELGRADDAFPPTPGGPLVAPLGYSLAVMGATWALGTWLTNDDPPWWQIVLGIGLGAASYGLSVALN